MKKLLTFSLAVVLVLSLSVTAFAYDWTPGIDVSTIELEIGLENFVPKTGVAGDNFVDGVTVTVTGGGTAQLKPKIGDYTIKNNLTTPKTSAVTAKLNDDETAVVITLKTNYSYTAKEIQGNVELKPKSGIKDVDLRQTFTWTATSAGLTVGASGSTRTITHFGYATMKITTNDDYEFNYSELKERNGGEDFIVDFAKIDDTMKISWGRTGDSNTVYSGDVSFYFEVRVNEQGKLNLSYNNKTNKEIVNANEDADLDFYNFPANPTFDFNGTARIYSDDADKYIYEITSSGLKLINADYDEDEESYTWKTRTLGSYVLSDMELDDAIVDGESDADGESDGDGTGVTNPQTGVADFVNVAVALATVSLAAAGAVVLKKK